MTKFNKWTWRGGGGVMRDEEVWGVRRIWRVGKDEGVGEGGGVWGGEGCFTIFTVFLYILLEPKNKIKVVFNRYRYRLR